MIVLVNETHKNSHTNFGMGIFILLAVLPTVSIHFAGNVCYNESRSYG